jgi:ubiquinone/menaquinone biosynthesis C-methylase UbiE
MRRLITVGTLFAVAAGLGPCPRSALAQPAVAAPPVAAPAFVVPPVVAPPRIDTAIDVTVPIPPPATHHFGREIAQTMHFSGAPWLVRDSRQREEDCRLLLEALEVRPGQTVCDLGCGNGFYTVELARRVGPAGVVYAIDIQPEMLRMLAERAAAERLTNIRPILGTVIDPRLPAGTVDLVVCVDVYHEFSHPEAMLARIRASLSPGGRLVLAEFRGEDPAVPIQPLHKMTKAQIRTELEPAGFAVAREFDRLPWQHLMFFRADGPPAGGGAETVKTAGYSGCAAAGTPAPELPPRGGCSPARSVGY